ncbi:MAG: hypothetical protein M3O41_18650 [Pseudomonadota bacterium]|nr:hypothetical protein [Pseudomonadota bacterium]
MHRVLDDSLVGIVLLASMIYAAFALGPRTLRRHLLAGAAALLRLPANSTLRALAARLDAAASIKAKGTCGGCDNCGPERPPAAPSSGSEFRIPLSKVGRRVDARTDVSQPDR